MYRNTVRALLLASAMLALPATAYAQDDKMAEPPADAVSPDDASLQAVPDSEVSGSDADAKMALLAAQLSALQTQMDELKKNQAKATPSWKGAPQWVDSDAGWSFKVRGRLQLDAAWMSKPPHYISVVKARNLGFNYRVRRFRLGAEGTLPGGFGYKVETEFSNAAVSFGDVYLNWTKSPTAPITITLGNQESLDGMEQISSELYSSFIERGQMDEAFNNTRRLGLVINAKTKDNLLRADVGMFAGHSIDGSLDNHGWIGAARVTYTPYVGSGFVHMGLNFQHRAFQKNTNGKDPTAGVGSPSVGRLARYRARPFLQTTDVRYADTTNFEAKSDNIFGAELWGVFKSFHVGGEAQYVKVNAYKVGDQLLAIDAFNGNQQFVPTGNPSFFSYFVEAGYFLTGETRGYKNGAWDRTKVLHPVQDGGTGAIQVVARYDYLDLNSSKLKHAVKNDFTTGAPVTTGNPAVPVTGDLRGGKQIGYLLGVNWMPMDYVRFMMNYIHTDMTRGPIAAQIKKKDFSTDAVAVRAQFDF